MKNNKLKKYMKMKKYEINYSEVLFYQTTEIKAKNEENAREKFLEKLNSGDIEVNSSDQNSIEIYEIE